MLNSVEIDFSRIDAADIVQADETDVKGCFDLTEQSNHISDFLRFINYVDCDIVYFSFLSGKKQCDIGKILGKTQPAISYDINRIKKQIDFVYFFYSTVDEFVAFLQSDNGLTAEECDLLLVLFYCSSIAKTSKVIGYHQITCRNRLAKIFSILRKDHPNIHSMIKYSLAKFNKIKKTYRHKC